MAIFTAKYLAAMTKSSGNPDKMLTNFFCGNNLEVTIRNATHLPQPHDELVVHDAAARGDAVQQVLHLRAGIMDRRLGQLLYFFINQGCK